MKAYNYSLKVHPECGKERIANPRCSDWYINKKHIKERLNNDLSHFPNNEFLGFVEKDIPIEYKGIVSDNGFSCEDYHTTLGDKSIEDIFEQFKGCKIKIKIEVEEVL